jgi:hypothetical protein
VCVHESSPSLLLFRYVEAVCRFLRIISEHNYAAMPLRFRRLGITRDAREAGTFRESFAPFAN